MLCFVCVCGVLGRFS